MAVSVSCAAIDLGILFEEPPIGLRDRVGVPVLISISEGQLWPYLSRVPPLILICYSKSRPLGAVIEWVSLRSIYA